jgi:Fe-S cluster biogenesis protein NfuA
MPHADDKDFQVKVQRIGELVGELDKISDPESRASAKALVQLLLDLHAVGLERVMEIVSKSDDSSSARSADEVPRQHLIDDLGRDPLVSSLLVLYGLHPMDLESRVAQAVEKVQPRVRKGGGELELLGIENGVVSLRLQVSGHGCGSTKSTLKVMVEDALYEAAPDLNKLLIEGLDEEAGASGFVPLGKLSNPIAAAPVMGGT